jgi:SNF2 family DNA or RNA helicase
MQKIIRKIEPRIVPKYKALDFQAKAVSEIARLDYGAIFHEQGLGKTKIAIDLILSWLEKKTIDVCLVVTKKGLIRNWQKEFQMHTHISPRIIGDNRQRNFYVFNSPARVMLTHYETMRLEKERFQLFLKTRDVAIILDESAKIKNPDTGITQALFSLSKLFKKRVIMTGTPMANRPYDLWAQIWFLDQGESLGDNFEIFKNEYDLSNNLAFNQDKQKELEKNLSGIYEKIARFSVREVKSSGIIKLPKKEYENIYTDWESRQQELYNQVQKNLRAIVIREGVPTADDSEEALKRLLRLVQIASNPRLIDESYRQEPGKLPYLIDLLEKVRSAGEKAIVWTSFTENVDWLSDVLKEYGTCRLHGKMDMDARNRSVQIFLTDPKVRVFIATPAAAKEGLTLTVANHVVFYDRSFSLDDYLQAQDRIHRISQERTCFIHNLIMSGSVDEWVDKLLTAKHLAAQLGQGDIKLSDYKDRASYDFGAMVRDILNMHEGARHD